MKKNPPTSTDSDSILSHKRKRTRRAENEDKAPLGELFCNTVESDKPENLCAAGTSQASAQKNNEQHAHEFTEKVKNMALFLDELEIFSKLSTGDSK